MKKVNKYNYWESRVNLVAEDRNFLLASIFSSSFLAIALLGCFLMYVMY